MINNLNKLFKDQDIHWIVIRFLKQFRIAGRWWPAHCTVLYRAFVIVHDEMGNR